MKEIEKRKWEGLKMKKVENEGNRKKKKKRRSENEGNRK